MNSLDILLLFQGGNNAYIWKYFITEGHSYNEVHKLCTETPSLLERGGTQAQRGWALLPGHSRALRRDGLGARSYVFSTGTVFDRRPSKGRRKQLSCILKFFLIIWRHLVAENAVEEKEFIPCHRKNPLFTEAWVGFGGEDHTEGPGKLPKNPPIIVVITEMFVCWVLSIFKKHDLI